MNKKEQDKLWKIFHKLGERDSQLGVTYANAFVMACHTHLKATTSEERQAAMKSLRTVFNGLGWDRNYTLFHKIMSTMKGNEVTYAGYVPAQAEVQKLFRNIDQENDTPTDKEEVQEMTEKRLFGAFEGAMGKGDFADELYKFAYNIETTLIQAGAKPGKDYTYLDLIKMAEPYMRDKMAAGERIEIIYPAAEVL